MASRGITAQRYQMYSADFETCDDGEGVEGKTPNQRVWLAGTKNLQTMKTERFTNIHDFMTRVLSRQDNINREYAIHNLKFDGSYILPWLFENGYTCVHTKPRGKEFTVLIDDRNNWYTLVVQVTNKRRITFWDSLKLFPTSLEYMPRIYGTPTHKLIEDAEFYNRVRDNLHKPTTEEIAYLENDLQVLAETLNAHIELEGLRFKKTQASQSFYNFEQHFKAWKLRFPPLDEGTDKDIRMAYWGGISYVKPAHQGRDMYGIDVYDINSSYPYQLAYQKLPYGRMLSMVKNDMPDMSKFWVAECILSFKLKTGKLPCIPTRAITEGKPITNQKWLADSHGIVRMKFCNIDYISMFESYDLDVLEWVGVRHWAWKIQPEIQSYIIHNQNERNKYRGLIKQTENEELITEYNAQAQRAKINNNSFYGKFGEDIIKEGKTPYHENDDIVYRLDRYDLQNEGKRKYLPVAIATTAWGRRQLVTLANELGDNFIYCDTDSVHILKGGTSIIKDMAKDDKIKLSKTDLGAWDFEGHYDRARFLRSKCYYEQVNGLAPDVTLAGLPADPHTGPRSKKRSCVTWYNFHIGLEIPKELSNKLGSKRTPTGIKLVPVPFRITPKDTLMYF